MNIKAFTVSDMVNDLHHGRKFSFARYGDGEWASIFQKKGTNCDGHYYFPRMGWELEDTLKIPHSEPYRYGLVRIAKKVFNAEILKYCKKREIGIDWYDGTGTVDASRSGELYPLINELCNHVILLVGPEHLTLNETFGFKVCSHIIVPDVNAYLSMLEIMTFVLEDFEEYEPDIIAFSSGPPTKVMMHKLYRTIGQDVTMIDFGSLWDGFCGKPSRRYQKTKYWIESMDANLGVENG